MNGHAQPSSLAGRSAWAVAASALAVFLLVAPAARPSQAAPAGETLYQVVLQVGAGSFAYDLPLGASVTLPISASVTGAQPLAAASVLIQYNPAVLRPTACVARPEGPGGYCNAAYDPENGLIRFSFISDTGVMGDAVFFDLTFETASTAAVGQESAVTLLVESLADIHGDYMTSRTQGSIVYIVTASGAGAAVYVGKPGGPNPISITRGLTATVPVVITGVAGVGSATFSLSFDPAIVRPLECRPIPIPYGDASGTCALHSDHVAANLLSLAGIPALATENVTAFEVVFTTAPGAQKNQKSPLNLATGAFADTAGVPITVRLINNALKISGTAGAVVPLLRLAPPAQNLPDDGRVTVSVYLDNGAQLAAGSWGIRYDPTVVLAEECWFSEGLLNAVCNATGEPGFARMSVLSIEAGGPPPQIGAITFRRHPQAQHGQKSSLTFEVTNFADAAGEQLEYDTQGAELTISEVLGSPAAVALRLIGTPPYLLYQGTSLDLPINVTIDPGRPIANLTASIHYDPLVLRPTRCLRSSAMGDSPMGYCNAQYDREKGTIRFNLLAAEGVSGSVTPFVLTLEAASTSVQGNNSPLHFTVEAVTGPLGEPRTWSATDEEILVKEPVPAPRVAVGPPELLATAIYTIALGSRATVPLWVEAVPDLGAGTVEVRYDPRVARATKCTLRSDLAPALDGGFCSLLDGVVRVAFVSSTGIDGDAHLYDIEFAQAPDVVGGETTPLAVVVNNFVNTREVPIPTSIRSGRLDISCYAKPVEDLHIARDGANLRLTWTHVGSTAVRYQVWRADVNAYFAFGDLDSTAISTTVPAPILGTSVAYTDTIGATNPISGTITGPWADDLNHYYMVRSMCGVNQGSLRSNRVGKFTRFVRLGMNLVSVPLLPYSVRIQDVVAVQLTGANSELDSDRVWVWDIDRQDYDYAWLITGVAPEYDGKWWDSATWRESAMVLPPNIGFWVQSRHDFVQPVKVVGAVAEPNTQGLAIVKDMQLIGSAYPDPVVLSLYAATFAQDGAHGDRSELDADRVWYWDESRQDYDYAWLIAEVAPEYNGKWWDSDIWAESQIMVRPGVGYWYQRRGYLGFPWTNPGPTR